MVNNGITVGNAGKHQPHSLSSGGLSDDMCWVSTMVPVGLLSGARPIACPRYNKTDESEGSEEKTLPLCFQLP